MKKDLNQFHDEVDYARCWQLDKMQDDGDCIHGILLAGEYGRSHPLVNAKSGKKAYHRTETDAPLEPFTFRMYLPDNKRAGILLSQRFGQAGILATIKSMLRDIMDAASPGYILVIRPLMPEKALKALLQKSKLASLRFTQDVISADIVERIDGRKQIQEGEVEIAIRPKRNGNLKTNYLVELLNGKKKVTDLIEFEDFEPDNVKAEVDMNGKKKIINFGKIGNLKASFDVTGEVQIGADGYAKPADLRKAATDLMDTLIGQLN
jgi:hypothetical protein